MTAALVVYAHPSDDPRFAFPLENPTIAADYWDALAANQDAWAAYEARRGERGSAQCAAYRAQTYRETAVRMRAEISRSAP